MNTQRRWGRGVEVDAQAAVSGSGPHGVAGAWQSEACRRPPRQVNRAPSEAPGSSRPPVSPQERGASRLGGAELKPGQPGPAGTRQACSGPQPPPEPCIHGRSVCSPRPLAGSCGASSPCVRCPCPAPVCAGQSPWQLGLVVFCAHQAFHASHEPAGPQGWPGDCSSAGIGAEATGGFRAGKLWGLVLSLRAGLPLHSSVWLSESVTHTVHFCPDFGGLVGERQCKREEHT